MDKNSSLNKKKIAIFVLILIAVFQLNLDKINPYYFPFYPLKRFQEKVYLTLKLGNTAQANYYQVLLDNRLKELVSISGGNDLVQVTSASSRYSTTAGELVNLIVKNNLQSEVTLILDQIRDHQTRLKVTHDKLLNKFGVVPTLEQRKQLQASMDALSIYSQAISNLK